MFEKFFGKEKTPEQKIKSVIDNEFEAVGINLPGIIRAFEAAKRENDESQLGFSNGQILDLIQDRAITSSGPIEDSLYGGVDNTMNNILSEINRLRKEHRD